MVDLKVLQMVIKEFEFESKPCWNVEHQSEAYWSHLSMACIHWGVKHLIQISHEFLKPQDKGVV